MQRSKFPRIKSYYSVVAHSSDYVELRSGIWNSNSSYLKDDKATGKLSKIILSIDGISTIPEIAKKCGVSRSELESLLDNLNSIGALEFGPSNAFDYYIDCSAPTLKRTYQEQSQLTPKHPILILGDETLSTCISTILNVSFNNEALIIKQPENNNWEKSLLAEDSWLYDGLALEEKLEEFKDWQGNFIVLALRHIDPNLSSRLNRIAFNLDIPWIHFAVDGPFLFVGPLFGGKIGPCYDCFEKRVSMNLREYKNYQSYKEALSKGNVFHTQATSYENILNHIVSSHAAMEIMNYILTGCSFVKNKVFSIYLPSMEVSFGEILRLSNCVTCGSIAKRNDRQVYFDYESLIQEELTHES